MVKGHSQHSGALCKVQRVRYGNTYRRSMSRKDVQEFSLDNELFNSIHRIGEQSWNLEHFPSDNVREVASYFTDFIHSKRLEVAAG